MSHFDNPILDGICPSWVDIEVRVKGILGGSLLKLGDIKAISSGSTVEVGEQREGGRVIQRTAGSVGHEAIWTLYASGYLKMQRALLPIAPLRGNQALISLVHFSIQILWTPPGSSDVFERRLKGCRLLGNKNDGAEGNDPSVYEMPLSPLEIADVVDGVEIVMI